jgi:hypothetical protein
VTTSTADAEAVIVGAGAAGLATAIFALRRRPGLRLVLVDGSRRPGAKILVSGGSRCNVTNVKVTEADFNGGRPAVIRTVLRALPVPATIGFFHGIGVPLHEEADGKLFPDSNRSRDVLNALLGTLESLGVAVRAEHRVVDLARDGEQFVVTTTQGAIRARRVVLATGGLSLPKSGSDGLGLELARRLGHTIVPTTPALAPLLLEDPSGFHSGLMGVSHAVRLTLRAQGAADSTRITGSMLWTHFGVSGPAPLDVSRHWLRARLEGRTAALAANLCVGESFETLEARWLELGRRQPRISVHTALSTMVPSSLGSALTAGLGISPQLRLAELSRVNRRDLVQLMLALPLAVVDSRGYSYAEATAGGVDLREVDPSTLESRRCAGLHLVGEILDVDGRLGGFNFQWAWSSAEVAARGLAAADVT